MELLPSARAAGLLPALPLPLLSALLRALAGCMAAGANKALDSDSSVRRGEGGAMTALESRPVISAQASDISPLLLPPPPQTSDMSLVYTTLDAAIAALYILSSPSMHTEVRRSAEV